MLYLKQSTASQAILLGPFVADTDGATAETGLSVANTDIRLSKNGGNLAAKNSGGGTHDEAGWYTITLDATDTATVGHLQLHCKMTGALMVHAQFQVLEEAIYDALFGASAAGFDANGRVDVASVAGTAQTAGDLAALVTTVDTVVDRIEVDTQDLQTQVGTAGAGLTNINLPNQTMDITGNLSGTVGGIAGTITTLDALDTAQDAQHASSQADIASLNDISAADVNAQVDTALSDIHLDHLLAADYDPASPPGTSTALLNELVESDGGVSRFTVNALENGPSGSGASASEIADAVWDEDIIAAHNTADTAGHILGDGETAWPTATGFSTHNAAGVWASGTRTLTANTNLNDPTAADVATAVVEKGLADDYAANGSDPTLQQCMMAVHQMLMDFGITGTSIAVRKVDGSAAFTVTLDSASAPTDASR